MRFVGLLGIITILIIGFLISRHRKQIRPRIILWGVGLQLLFAAIILAENALSWIAMFLFAFLILLYIFEEKFVTEHSWKDVLFPGLAILVSSVIAVVVFYFMDRIRLASPFLFLLIGAYIVLLVIKHREYTKYLTGTAIWAY
jgi:hypothetical protein